MAGFWDYWGSRWAYFLLPDISHQRWQKMTVNKARHQEVCNLVPAGLLTSSTLLCFTLLRPQLLSDGSVPWSIRVLIQKGSPRAPPSPGLFGLCRSERVLHQGTQNHSHLRIRALCSCSWITPLPEGMPLCTSRARAALMSGFRSTDCRDPLSTRFQYSVDIQQVNVLHDSKHEKARYPKHTQVRQVETQKTSGRRCHRSRRYPSLTKPHLISIPIPTARQPYFRRQIQSSLHPVNHLLQPQEAKEYTTPLNQQATLHLPPLFYQLLKTNVTSINPTPQSSSLL